VDEWHEAINQRVVDPFIDGPLPRRTKGWQRLVKWDRCGIGEWDSEKTNPSTGEHTRWQIRELCSNRAFNTEGRSLHHCALSYVKSCRSGNTTIWSLSAKVDETRTSVLTIAVDPRSRIVTQARGKYNASLAAAETGKGNIDRAGARLMTRARPVMERWMRRERLRKS